MAEIESKESVQSDVLMDFLTWLNANKKQVVTGVLIVAGLAAVGGIYRWHRNASEAKANEALFALPTGQMSRTETAAKAEDFLKVAREKAGTTAAERAALLGAGHLFSEGKYDKAAAAFEQFLSDYSSSPYRAQAAFGAAASLEAQSGKAEQAVAKYQEVERQYQGESIAPLAMLARARLLEEQGKADEALKVYSAMESNPNPMDVWKSEAMDRKERLLAKHPELAPKPAPVQEQVIKVTTPTAAEAASTNASKP